ncbi:MAG: translation initiation factor IF-3 [Bacilli bacterium]|nr:translation initiation factor IF-3 [Bacilli bacterium]
MHILLVGNNGDKLGIMDYKDAENMAKDQHLDLVCVSKKSELRVFKLMDYKKHLYIMKKKMKKGRKSVIKTKIIKISPQIDTGDFKTKVNNAKKFLNKGYKVELQLFFKGRQKNYQELGENKINEFKDELKKDIAFTETKLEKNKDNNKNLRILITPST